MRSRWSLLSVGALLANQGMLAVPLMLRSIAFITYLSLQFTEQDLKDVGRGLGEAIYRRHRMITSKRSSNHWITEHGSCIDQIYISFSVTTREFCVSWHKR